MLKGFLHKSKKILTLLNIFDISNKFFIFILVALFASLYYYFFNPLREGVVFTPYDNATWFNKPWDKFCIQTPPSCQRDNEYAKQVNGNPTIGCWCNDEQKAPDLDNDCTDLDFNPFIEYKGT